MKIRLIKPQLIIVSLIMLVTAGCINPQGTNEIQKPNIIFIMADDLGYADIGAYGQQYIQTPRLDELAAKGMVFTQHYAGNTVCAPSRCSLMTGKHPGNAFVRGNKQYPPAGQLPLPDGTITVSSLLKKAGYSTGMVGKWGLGNIGNSGEPGYFDWDFYYGYLDQVLAHNYYPEYLIRNGKKEFLNNEVQYLSDTLWHKGLGSFSLVKKDYSHDLFAEAALEFINENRYNPFFLYLPFTIPHDNGEAPRGERMEVPDEGLYRDSTGWDSDMRGYAAMISRLDKDIGRIVDLLRSLQLEQNTLVLFTSDNGPMPGETFTEYFDSNGQLRGGKRDMYEGGIRVPLIANWPGKIEEGTTSDHISAFWDFLPTACDLAGIDPPADTDGISFLPELLGEDQAEHAYLYWESPLKGFMTAVRLDNWKAVKNGFNSPIELYDLEQDIGESQDLATEFPDVIQHIEEIITEAHTPSVHFPRPDEI